MTHTPTTEEQEAWGLETRLVHGGTLRSQFAETVGGALPHPELRLRLRRAGGGALQERGAASSTAATPTQRLPCSRSACGCWRAPRRLAPPPPAWPPSPPRCSASSRAGDHVVAARALFGSCRYVVEDLCPRYGIASTLVDGRDLDAWKRAMRPNTKAVFFETPANPTLDLVDIAAVSEIAHKAGALVVVDNVFATPVLQKPLKHGADVVVYSATKHVDGQGRVPRRHRAGLAGLREGPPAQLPQAHRAIAQPLQCVGDAQGARDPPPARARAMRGRGPASPTTSPPRRASRACSTAGARITRRRRSPSGRCRASARS